MIKFLNFKANNVFVKKKKRVLQFLSLTSNQKRLAPVLNNKLFY